MWFLYIVIGLLIGLGAAFLYWKKMLKPKYELEVRDYRNCANKLAKVYEMLSACHNAVWGPVGLHPQIAADLFNKVWEWAGLPENGLPKK